MRIQKIYANFSQLKLDALIISSPANISYLTRFSSRDSYLLISKKANIYITDSRYTEEAKNGLKGQLPIRKINGSVFQTIADACNDLKLKRIGFEEKFLSFAGYKKMRKELTKGIDLIPAGDLVEQLREIKDADELEKIKRAAQITIKAFKFIKDFVVPGRTEIEIAAELERFVRYNGARSSSFDIIVGSGPNSSYPHHLTSQRKIKNNEPVLIDMGVEYMGYKSDLTRVFFLGKMNPILKTINDVVRKAQYKAIKEIKPAVPIDKIDTAARQYITQKGYGGFFGHNLGHGIGLEVHEKPRIAQKETSPLKRGMIFTIEPGVYLPGKFGVRIEDMVLVTRKGCEVISGSLDK